MHAYRTVRDAAEPEVSAPTEIFRMSISIAGIARYRLYAICRIAKQMSLWNICIRIEVDFKLYNLVSLRTLGGSMTFFIFFFYML